MRDLTIQKVIEACGGVFYGDDAVLRTKVQGVALDSRRTEAGYLDRKSVV